MSFFRFARNRLRLAMGSRRRRFCGGPGNSSPGNTIDGEQRKPRKPLRSRHLRPLLTGPVDST
jgi:hypothetical protein